MGTPARPNRVNVDFAFPTALKQSRTRKSTVAGVCTANAAGLLDPGEPAEQAHVAFIAETQIDRPGDDRRNVEALKKLVT